MNPRIRARRREVSRQRGRRRASLALLGVLALVALACFFWLRSSDIFAVKRVSANSTVHVTAEEIRSAVGAEILGKNLLALSARGISKRLLELPYVRSVEVRRRFPDTLHVQVSEYEPVARVRLGDDVWLVADDGRVLERAAPPRGASLPLFVSEATPDVREGSTVPASIVQALTVAELLSGQDQAALAGLSMVKYVSVSAAGMVVLVLADGSEVRLGEPRDLDQKLRVACKIMKDYLREGRQLQYVDVTVPDRAAVSAVKAD